MGEVWLGRHRETQEPVAVKIVPPGRHAVLFRREVEAVAALDHPNIIGVYDHGLVDGVSGLAQGAPYLVMERARGSLVDVGAPNSWDEVRQVLTQILAGLAHAHAHGVVHRDLKPGNVLLCARDFSRGVKLADFGIAVAMHEAGTTWVTGTPQYMAPEQFAGAWRDQGPWTDLYALGCMAWELVSGSPLFTATSVELLRQAHQSQPVPMLVPRMSVPAGFDEWLRALLVKDPRARADHAADVAEALGRLGEARGWIAAATPLPEARTWVTAATLVPSDLALTLGALRTVLPRAAVAEQWVPRTDHRRVWEMAGAGLGLIGLRPVPLAGREQERDLLWRALMQVLRDGRAAAVTVRGPAGVGKTRLADEVALRAAETGAATVVRITHAPIPGPEDGLRGAVVRALRLHGLTPEEAAVRVAAMGVPEAAGLVDGEPDAVLAWLSWAAQRRPILLVVDDAQYGQPAVALVRELLGTREVSEVPILALVLVQDEALAERGGAVEVGEPLTLGPLASMEMSALVGGLLGLEEGLAGRVQERAVGNAGFAVQLVTEQVERGLLIPTAGGFALRSGATLVMPESVEAVWEARLLGALRDIDPAAVEVLAVLGVSAIDEEWRAACEAAGVTADEVGLWALERGSMVRRDPGGWSFTSGLVREVAVSRVRRAGRWGEWNAACASMLAGGAGRRRAERRGLHILESGDPVGAVPDLLLGVEERSEEDDYQGALWLCGLVRAALLGSDDDELRMHHLRLEGTALLNSWRLEEAEVVNRAHLQLTELSGDVPARQRALRLLAVTRYRSGDAEGAEGLARRGLALGPYSSQRAGLYRVLGHVLQFQRRIDEAEVCYREVLAVPKNDNFFDVSTSNDLAEVLRVRGDLVGARALYEVCLERCRDAGYRDQYTTAVNLALLDLEEGLLEDARIRLVEIHAASAQRAGLLALAASGVLLHAIDALQDRWSDYIATERRADELTRAARLYHPDIAAVLERAARAADATGPVEARRSAWLEVADQWEHLGDPERAEVSRRNADQA
jgi:tetratricopeptide (TPR) repeat protein